MGRNKTGGKSHRRHSKRDLTERVVPTKQEGQDYAVIDTPMGDGRFWVQVGPDRVVGRVCGRMRRKRWVRPGDQVLCSRRLLFDTSMVDIIHVYSAQDVEVLKSLRQLPHDDDDVPGPGPGPGPGETKDDDDIDIDIDAI